MNKGQTIIEAMVAFSILVLVLTAIVSVVVLGMSNATFARNQNLANRYAQEGMEFLRDMEKYNFPDFRTYGGPGQAKVYCLDENKTIPMLEEPPVSCLDHMITGTFVRRVSFTQNGAECKTSATNPSTEVTVTVSWSSSKCPTATPYCHRASFSSCFDEERPGKSFKRGGDL